MLVPATPETGHKRTFSDDAGGGRYRKKKLIDLMDSGDEASIKMKQPVFIDLISDDE